MPEIVPPKALTELSVSWQRTKEVMAVARAGSILIATLSSRSHFQT